mgnify:CR=1 FL=1
MQITANFDVILRNATFWQFFLHFFGLKVIFLQNKENLEHLNVFRRNFFVSDTFRYFEV